MSIKEVLKKEHTGLGLMNFTWRAEPIPEKDAIEMMYSAYQNGVRYFNAGEFYGPNNINLKYVCAFFDKYPELKDKIILSVKGAIDGATLSPTADAANVRSSIDNILSHLGDKKLDLFECARVDPKVALEESILAVVEYIKAGKVGGLSVSEVTKDQIIAINKIYPIECAEVELSLYSPQILHNGVADICNELDIPIIAYSPLGRGMLGGNIKNVADLPVGDFRANLKRFKGDNLAKNLVLYNEVEKFAKEKGVTPAQFSLGWIRYLSGRKYGKLIPIPGSTNSSRIIENSANVILTDEEAAKLDEVLKEFVVIGDRYEM